MIKFSDIASRLATDIETDSVLNDYLAQYGKPSHIYVGATAESPAFSEDECPLIAIAPPDVDCEYGAMVEMRQIPVLVRWAIYDQEADNDGRRTTFLGISRCDDIGHELIRILKARAVTEGGNCASIQYRVGSEPGKWPLCEGRMLAYFWFNAGLAEPTMTTTEASA